MSSLTPAPLSNPSHTTNLVDQVLRETKIPLDELSPQELQILEQAHQSTSLEDQLEHLARIADVNLEGEYRLFLETHTTSLATRKTYRQALVKLELWSKTTAQPILALTPTQADSFVTWLCQSGAASSSVRVTMGAAGSFFTWLERRYPWFENPLRGTNARPPKTQTRAPMVPSAAEVTRILEALDPKDAAAVAVMSFRGLRVGALPELSIRGGRFRTTTKGQGFAGEMDERAIAWIKRAGLDPGAPFAGSTAQKWSARLGYLLKNLHTRGLVSHPYSPHDLRHFYALQEYGKNQDIGRLMVLLGHAAINVTETYLKGILPAGRRPGAS